MTTKKQTRGPFGKPHPENSDQWVCGCDETNSNHRAMCEGCGYFSPAVEKSAGPLSQDDPVAEPTSTAITPRSSGLDPVVQAREVTTSIKRGLESLVITAVDLGHQLVAAHTAKVWEPLGYKTWTSYLEGEFSVSRRRLYGHMVQALAADETGNNQITMRQASEVMKAKGTPAFPKATKKPRKPRKAKAPAVIEPSYTKFTDQGLPYRVQGEPTQAEIDSGDDPEVNPELKGKGEVIEVQPGEVLYPGSTEITVIRTEVDVTDRLVDVGDGIYVAPLADEEMHAPIVEIFAGASMSLMDHKVDEDPAVAFIEAMDLLNRTMLKHPDFVLVAKSIPQDEVDELKAGLLLLHLEEYMQSIRIQL